MKLTPVTALNTPDLILYRDLRGGAIWENLFIADSPKVVNLLLDDPAISIQSILATEEYYHANRDRIAARDIGVCFVAEKSLIETIVGHKLHHSVMLCGQTPEQTPLAELGAGIVMLEGISSSENIGAIARSAAGFGVSSLLVPRKGPHPFGRRALRVSMGYIARLQIHCYEECVQTISELQQMGYRVLGAEITPHSMPLSQLAVPERWVLLLGHEGCGLSAEAMAACDAIVHIQMNGSVKSLNVAAAGAIMMYHLQNPQKS